jgi:hypothetical protein
MTAEREAIRARRYLLGRASADERIAAEEEYFADERALERMESAEEQLIEDYLSNRLGGDDRRRFEAEYLSAPHRRTRVEAIRALITAANHRRPAPWGRFAAAALIIVALGGWWVLRDTPTGSPRSPAVGERGSQPSTSTAPARRIFVLAISPTAVRSGGGQRTLVIPAGTDVVRLNLEGDADTTRLARARARIRTVAGGDVWSGPATAASDAPSGTIAQVDVPADRLPVDDYVVELYGADAAGVERERARYFVAVRAR